MTILSPTSATDDRRATFPCHEQVEEVFAVVIERGDVAWHPIGAEISSHLPFTPVVEANGFVFVSGQASVDATGRLVPGSFEEEMRRSMANVVSVLASAGLTLRDVVRVTSYVHDAADGPRYNELYREYFAEPFPARTTLSNCLSPALKFEIDVIAVRPSTE